MKRIIIAALVGVLVSVFIGPGLVAAEKSKSPSLHKLFLHHAIVGYMKEADGKSNKQLLAFFDENPRAAYSLAEFWWKWAVRDCDEWFERRVDREFKKKSDFKKVRARLEDEHTNCIEAFIFQRWNDINASFHNKRMVFGKDKKN